jgi:hypothetical protein
MYAEADPDLQWPIVLLHEELQREISLRRPTAYKKGAIPQMAQSRDEYMTLPAFPVLLQSDLAPLCFFAPRTFL